MVSKALVKIRQSKWLFPILTAISLFFLALAAIFGIVINVLVIGGVLVVSSFCLAYWYPRYNILILLSCAFFTPFLTRAFHLYDFSIAVTSEILSFLLLFTLILKGKVKGGKSLPGVMILVWLTYEIAELLNPYAASRIAGFHAIRNVITMVIGFFIMFSSVESKKDVYLFFIGWMILSLLAGMYGLYQEFAGLPSYDFAWANYTEERYNTLFTWGHLRKFSFFFSPSEFGMIMAYAGVIAVVMVFSDVSKQRTKVFAAFVALITLWSMMYTGSRTAMAMLPVGLLIFALITLKRSVLYSVGAVMLAGVAMVLRPMASGSLFIMLTAFSADDPSLQVRLMNQEIIQSYIREHPIGFGLGSTGYYGNKYSPNTFVASFPPDSEYVKVAIESGWVGLFLWCAILAFIFGYGVQQYFKIKDKTWKDVLLITLVVFFMIIVAQYPQELFNSPGLSLLFSAIVGLMAKIPKLAMRNEIALQP